MERCDIAIVGGGIAGLSMAKFLAEKGIPFILFEEHTNFFMKPCGEGIIARVLGYDFYDLYGSKEGIEKEVMETNIHTKYGILTLEMPIIMTDKKKIEAEFARQAEKQGEIRMGEKVGDIKNGTLLPQKIKPKIIVGADGIFSIVRKYIGAKTPRCGIAIRAYSNEVELDDEKCHVIRRDDVVKYGYAWFFPKRKKWNIGIGSGKKKFFKAAYQKFRQENPNAFEWKGAYIPLDMPIKSYGKNAILIGDAAAHVSAAIGEGIMPSIIIAKIASDFIEKAAKKDYKIDLSLYEKAWKEAIGRYLKRSYYLKILFFSMIRSEYIRYKLLAKMCKEVTKYYRRIMKR